MKGLRAFTLVELLVTIAIIAVLAALIMAAVNSVRSKADAAKCASNLRQLVSANLTYAAENNGQFVPAQEPTNLIRWHGVRTSVNSKFDPSRGPLAPYLGTDGRVKLCPALARVLSGKQSFEDGTGGYGYNATYVGGTPLDPYTPARLSALETPSRVIMFADCAFPRQDGLQEYAYAEPWQWVDYRGRMRGALDPSVHFRHSDCANVAWCDGHISAEPYSKLGSTNSYGGNSAQWKVGWFGPSANNGYWAPSSGN
jgi:prepilin-type N-terminal cleavage/methylation domain-containing protein/prepilin-type processing-associated H-X9-DG protein